MNDELITANLLTALNVVVLRRLYNQTFTIIGNIPSWFLDLYPIALNQQDELTPGENFLFLDNFLIDAENYWQGNIKKPLKSGLWVEVDAIGREFYLEATAVKIPNQDILLLSLGEITIDDEKKLLIQKARENSLNYQDLVREIQKKEILIHCIVHDLAGPLTGMKYCFELLDIQNLSGKAKEYLETGKKQVQRQEILIREILDAFAAEVDAWETFTIDPDKAPDALICLNEVIDALTSLFALNKMQLQLMPGIDFNLDWRVVGEKSRLERVLSNLIENAWRHSSPNSVVEINIQQQSDSILFTIDDQGSGVSPDVAQNLFQKFTQGKYKAGKSGLGLYFCRITVERWGGSIGYLPRAGGGSRFWFSLPKIIK